MNELINSLIHSFYLINLYIVYTLWHRNFAQQFDQQLSITHGQKPARCYKGSQYDRYVQAVISRRLIDMYNCTVAFAVWGYSAKALRRRQIQVCGGRQAELAMRHFETTLLAREADWGKGFRSVVEQLAFDQSWALVVLCSKNIIFSSLL